MTKSETPATDGIRIMVVDDQRSMRALVHSTLRQIGLSNVTECENGQEALRELANRPVDLIVSDLNMPALDGLGLLRAVRKDPATKSTPFIMVTSLAEVAIVKEAIALGVNNYIVKPFTVLALKQKVEAVLGPIFE